MAKLKSENLELEFKLLECHKYDLMEYDFRCTLTWKGIPVLNDKAFKRSSSYWKKGSDGGIIGEEMDSFSLITELEEAVKTKEMRIWESWPDPDMCVAIYPNRCFPDLITPDQEYHTIIFSPDVYQFRDMDCYSGYEGVSFVMTPTEEMLIQFINDLKKELLEIENGIKD